MKKLSIAAILCLVFAFSVSAQPNRLKDKAQDKVQAYKIAFFTEKLQLTPEESKTFWPLYNQYEDEQEALKQKNKIEGRRIEMMSDKEVEEFVLRQLDAEEQMTKLRGDYTHRFMEVLPIRKVAMLNRVDNEFKRAILEEIKLRRENRQDPAAPARPCSHWQKYQVCAHT